MDKKILVKFVDEIIFGQNFDETFPDLLVPELSS